MRHNLPCKWRNQCLMFILFLQMVSYDSTATGYVPYISLPCRHTMTVTLTNFDEHVTSLPLLSIGKLMWTVAIFGLQICLHRKHDLLNFSINFATLSWIICIICVALEVHVTWRVVQPIANKAMSSHFSFVSGILFQ